MSMDAKDRARRNAVKDLPDDWIVPSWPAPRNVHAFFTTRNVNASDVRTTSFDVGGPRAPDDSGERATIAAHRRLLDRLLPSSPVWLDQVHGTDVVTLDRSSIINDDPPRADAAVTRKHDVVLAVRVADCMPVLFASADGAAIGAAHAGWRGLAAGVLERTIDAMRCAPTDLVAWIGPCISAPAYEVGDDVYDAFVRRDNAAASAFKRSAPGKWHADLIALAQQRLAQSGVVNVTRSGFCTASDSRRFFSFRRDGATGRMAALIWRTEC
jgi:YfiH family protein